jgi:saccharopepsin
MKYTPVVLAAALAGADARIHKLKMNKVPLEEQLKAYTMHDMSRMLGAKYSHQNPSAQFWDAFTTQKDGHKVPVTNYMNAQCKHLPLSLTISWRLTNQP